MGKAARNRKIRKLALELDYKHARRIARAFRRHGRMPIEQEGGSPAPTQAKWTSRNRRMARKYSDFRKKKGKR